MSAPPNRSTAPRGLPQLFNAAAALCGLAATAPLLGLAALAIRLTSPGPVLFAQARLGRGGRPFLLFKLRTMTTGAAGPRITSGGDARVTPLGRLLRRYKLDELPQLVNVLRGQMALVGPRPEVAEYVDLRDPAWQEVLSVLPGVTDPVTLLLRNEEALLAAVDDPGAFYRQWLAPFKLAGYRQYVRTRSRRGDLLILVATLRAVALGARSASPSVEDIKRGWQAAAPAAASIAAAPRSVAI